MARFAGLVATGGSVLDVAAGSGRHARWFEARGHRVTAIDRDAGALAASAASETLVHDLEAGGLSWPLDGRRFDAVVVTNYLHRPLMPCLCDALADGGALIYETFAVGNARFGRPANPAFLLRTGELLAHFGHLTVVAFEDGIVTEPRPASVQRICVVRDAPSGDDPPRRHAL